MSDLDFNVQLIRRIEALERMLGKISAIDPISSIVNIPGIFWDMQGIRGAWNFVNRTQAGVAIDLTGQGFGLTPTGAQTPSVGTYLAPFVTLDGTSQYYGRTVNTDYAFTGAITLGCWVHPSSVTTVNFMGKTGASGNFGYGLQFTGGNAAFYVSGDGTATPKVIGAPITAGNDYCIVGRYTPSTELAIWINGVKYTNTTSIPAAIFNNTALFQVGAASALSQFYPGDISLPWISAQNVIDRSIDIYFQGIRPMFVV